MHANSRTIAVAREWVIKAENDLKNAAHRLKLAKACPTDTVGFHAQQCVEKYLKALLVCKLFNSRQKRGLDALSNRHSLLTLLWSRSGARSGCL